MEDAFASQGAIAELDVSKVPNWANLLPSYQEGGKSAYTIRREGKIVAVPYISNANSLAFNFDEISKKLNIWEALFDSQFRGRSAMQNDFGPTLTNTAIYLKQSGKGSIDNPSDMTEDKVRQTCEFLIDLKKGGHFRTLWDGVQNGADLLSSKEVPVSSCWEVIQIFAARKNGQDIRYGSMKEGHQLWNNVVMLTKGGMERGVDGAFYSLANLFLIHGSGPAPWPVWASRPRWKAWVTILMRTQTISTPTPRPCSRVVLPASEERLSKPGNSWQNVFPTNICAYQDWWARFQPA